MIIVNGKEMFISYCNSVSNTWRSFDRRYLTSAKKGVIPTHLTDLQPEKATEVYKAEKVERLSIVRAIAERNERIGKALAQEKAHVRACIRADEDYFVGYLSEDYDSLELGVLYG